MKPQDLINMMFTIPVFNAATQMYKCIEVIDYVSAQNPKKQYELYLEWIPTSYSVPSKMRLDVLLSNSNNVDLILFEKLSSGNYERIHHKVYTRTHISSVKNIEDALKRLVNG